MMNASGSLVVAMAMFAIHCIPVSAAELPSEKIDRLNDMCRGGSGDDQKTIKACGERDSLIKAKSKQRPEIVSLYLPNDGKNGNTYALESVTIVAYPERPCHLTEVPNYQYMRVATISRSPVCYFKRDGKVIAVGPQIGITEYPEAMFAVSTVNPDGVSATVTHPGFDSELAMKKYMEMEREKIRRTIPGASLPPREIRP